VKEERNRREVERVRESEKGRGEEGEVRGRRKRLGGEWEKGGGG
jgi:hypothetical protein